MEGLTDLQRNELLAYSNQRSLSLAQVKEELRRVSEAAQPKKLHFLAKLLCWVKRLFQKKSAPPNIEATWLKVEEAYLRVDQALAQKHLVERPSK